MNQDTEINQLHYLQIDDQTLVESLQKCYNEEAVLLKVSCVILKIMVMDD